MRSKQRSFNWAESAAREKVNVRPLKRCPHLCGLPRAICGSGLAVLGITSALIALTIPQAAHAQVTEVITRPAGEDTINWGQINVPPVRYFRPRNLSQATAASTAAQP